MLFFRLKRRTRIIIASFFLVIAIVCVVRLIMVLCNATKNQIPDTNGDSKGLCSIDDAYIESVYSYSDILRHHREKKRDTTSGIRGYFEDRDSDWCLDTAELLSGVYVCNAYLASDDAVEYLIKSTVTKGNLRIVITDEDNKILYDVPIDTEHRVTINTVKGKVYMVKLVGESAEIEVTIERFR